MKKFIAFLLLVSFINILPCSAIMDTNTSTKTKTKTKKMKQEKISPIEYINIDWWKEYNDKELEKYILRAIENNYDLKIATLKVEEARQSVKAQFANELPSLSVGASAYGLKLPSTTNTAGMFSVPIIPSYELDLFLKNRDKTKSQKKMHEISFLNEKSAYLSITSTVGSTYFNIVKADKLIELQDKIVQDRKKIFELMKQSNEEGLISTSDLVKAEKAYIISESDLIELEKARTKLLNALAVLVGDSPNNIEEYKRISYDDLKSEKNLPDEISSEIIDNRPDYLIAEKMVEKAGIDVRIARKEFLPSINLNGLISLGTMSLPGMGSFNWRNAVAGFGGMLSLPLFTGGAKTANLRINQNKYEQILQNYHKTNLTAIQEVNNTLSDLKLNNEKYNKNLKALNMEEKDFEFTKDKYREGIISYLDLMQKEETLLNTEKMVVSSKIDEYISQISLYNATAGATL